ncbi:MAG: sigma-E processing peptidase SpoIIGA [Oscillospiraceae bacterium]|nr:sigma-E processing peptidase SpoIIGA [Oscillospiraceae bacterium]
MHIYLDLVVLLNFSVDFLLLLAVNRLCGYPLQLLRSAAAAGIGGAFAGVCMLRSYSFMGGLLWRTVILCIMSVTAFGWNRSAVRRGVLMILLSMSLGGIAICIGKGGFWGILASAGAMLVLCTMGFYGGAGKRTHVPVELIYGGKRYRMTALQDTGNTLKDPLTGQQILVAGPEIAWDVLGLTPGQLADPVQTMAQGLIPGLRLIPYRAVGQSCGMLLAIRFDSVKIAGAEGGRLVAFSPNSFGSGSAYQALTGGEI